MTAVVALVMCWRMMEPLSVAVYGAAIACSALSRACSRGGQGEVCSPLLREVRELRSARRATATLLREVAVRRALEDEYPAESAVLDEVMKDVVEAVLDCSDQCMQRGTQVALRGVPEDARTCLLATEVALAAAVVAVGVCLLAGAGQSIITGSRACVDQNNRTGI